MFRGYVLRYLGAVGAGGELGPSASVVPAPLRWWVRRRARRSLIAAGFETERADDTAHVHRIAYLMAAAVPTLDVNDVEGVRGLFRAKRRLDLERRAPVAFLGQAVALLALVAAGLGGWAYATGRMGTGVATGAASAAAGAEQPGPVVEAPAEPAHPLHHVFERLLPEYVVALDARSAGRERSAPNDVATRRGDVLEALDEDGQALVEPMKGLFDAAEHYAATTVGAADDDLDRWYNQLGLFHRALEDKDVPFYVDAVLTANRLTGRRRLLLSSYEVRERRTFRVGDRRIRALDLVRLDQLNFRQSLLGYTRPEVDYALVRLDQVESFLVEDVLPSVHSAAESLIVRGYEDEANAEWVTTFEDWAHEDLRAEADALVRDALGTTKGLDALAAAVVQRRNAITAVNGTLLTTGLKLEEPSAYRYGTDALDPIRGRVHGTLLTPIRESEVALAHDSVRSAYDVLHAARALSIAEHEVQHRLDYDADRLVAVPEVLSQYTGETEAEDRVNHRAESANAELSAYLAQAAYRPALVRTSLIHVASFLMNRHNWRKPEAYAALALFESLAAEAGIEHQPLLARRRFVRAELARIYGALRQMPPTDLSALAGRTWSRLYGATLPKLELEP